MVWCPPCSVPLPRAGGPRGVRESGQMESWRRHGHPAIPSRCLLPPRSKAPTAGRQRRDGRRRQAHAEPGRGGSGRAPPLGPFAGARGGRHQAGGPPWPPQGGLCRSGPARCWPTSRGPPRGSTGREEKPVGGVAIPYPARRLPSHTRCWTPALTLQSHCMARCLSDSWDGGVSVTVVCADTAAESTPVLTSRRFRFTAHLTASVSSLTKQNIRIQSSSADNLTFARPWCAQTEDLYN